MAKTVDLKTLPVLKGWVALPPAGQAMRVSRQRAFQMIEEGKIRSAVRVLGSTSDTRPAAYLVRVAEVLELAVENCPDCQREFREAQARDENAVIAEYCAHWEFPEQDVIYDDTEPVEHAMPAAAALAETAAAQ